MKQMTLTRAFLALPLALTLALAGCGNDPNRGAGNTLLKDITQVLRKTVSKGDNKGGAQTDAQVAQLVPLALKRVKGSALLALLNDGKQVAVLGEQENRAGYMTYTTTERQTLTLRGGIITSSRGLGGDLMSSSVDETARLVRARSAGQGQRVMRFLTGDWQEVGLSFACRVSRDQAETIPTATRGNVQTQRMIEICRSTSGGTTFTNIYWVSGGGTIWQSRQWLGNDNGYIAVSLLRP
ncbi:YjbF family lipoprotein [Vannielia sp.]|uniref:YjbF family lipoprotein n=1 Tax=Vannielia sp. TaxID=2813045 RepID=UPI00261A89B0|nr:YjbF family lipoprotein [Vannielia sp.]MDF1872318.1 YjbF family lipoprotein [Vannielia sp.]